MFATHRLCKPHRLFDLENDKDVDADETEDKDECRISSADDMGRGSGWW